MKSKGGKLSPMGERGKREKRLRAEGRAAYAASKKPKATTTTTIKKTNKYAPTPYGKYTSKAASGDSWKRGKTGK